MSRRDRHVVDALIGLLVVVLFVLVVAGVLAASYPQASQRIFFRAISSDTRVFDAAVQARQASLGAIDRMREGFEYRVASGWELLFGDDDSRTSSGSTSTASPVPPGAQGCETCHEGYRDRRRFTRVYFDHPLHEAEDIGCSRCHALTGTNRDTVPAMEGCVSCHTETKDAEGCITCHPPGTLFHGGLVAGDRSVSEDCEVCHPSGALEPNARSHGLPVMSAETDTCSKCHKDSFCNRCHPPEHGPGYGTRHPTDLAARVATPSECWSCHDSTWCAMTCHADPSRGAGAQ